MSNPYEGPLEFLSESAAIQVANKYVMYRREKTDEPLTEAERDLIKANVKPKIKDGMRRSLNSSIANARSTRPPRPSSRSLVSAQPQNQASIQIWGRPMFFDASVTGSLNWQSGNWGPPMQPTLSQRSQPASTAPVWYPEAQGTHHLSTDVRWTKY